MKESDVVVRTGLSIGIVKGYRKHCGVSGTEWGDESLKKLEGYLGVKKGEVKANEWKEKEEELVVSRICLNPCVVLVRREGDVGQKELMRMRVPGRRWKVGMRVKGRERKDGSGMWDFRGMVR
jgi:hypothetical protein